MSARTDVYYNLHSGVWSLLDRKAGTVYDHARVVVSGLPVALVVQPAGQRRVVEEKSKNVHAFIRGSYLEPCDDVARWQAEALTSGLVLISYNPYRGPSFYRKDTRQDVTGADSVIMLSPGNAPPLVYASL